MKFRWPILILIAGLPAGARGQDSFPAPNIGETGRIKMKRSDSEMRPSAAWTTRQGTAEVEWTYTKMENPWGEGSYFRLEPIQLSCEEKLFGDPKKPKKQTDGLTLKLQKGALSTSPNVTKERAQEIVDKFRVKAHLCKTSFSMGLGPPEQWEKKSCHASEAGLLFVFPSSIPAGSNPADETVAFPNGLSVVIKVKEATEPRIVWQVAGEDKAIHGECSYRLYFLSGTVALDRKSGRFLSAQTRLRFAGEMLAKPPDAELHVDITLEFTPDVKTDPPK